MVEIKIVYTKGEEWERMKNLPFLTPADIKKADRYLKEEDKIIHIVSAYLKRKYVGEWKIAEKGKPYAAGVYFNVSHTGGAVAIALSDKEVGIDIERVRPVEKEVREYISSEEEKGLPHTDEMFFKLWTAKESLVKATGTGFEQMPDKVPAFPTEGAKEYENKSYYSRQMILGDLMLSVTRLTSEPFDWKIEEERIG